ncbi:MAG TPA: hypothetical protein VEH04_05730 [Verrucomicrobiae bacterium]|nr:hypothetical protein [Verrucomicrobiae bacterium]
MAQKRAIAILLHETDSYPRRQRYFIWALCDVWRSEGIEIRVLKGPDGKADADLLIPHIDLTVLPHEYAKAMERFPRVANRNLSDISKRVISRNLIDSKDAYEGPVIVKTNLNYGGMPEARLCGTSVRPTRRRWWQSLFGKPSGTEPDWSGLKTLPTTEYRIFKSRCDVPAAVFGNPALVVEKFLPEVENGFYYLRIYQFLGDCGYCARLGSREPIVKMKSVVTREEIPVPDEIVALRRELGIDYGKMDFVMRDGRVVLFDVNRTPGLIQPPARLRASASKLAPGINSFF